MSELPYTRSGDYLIPDLSLTEQPQAPLGKYGRMRKDYLKEHRPLLWNSLLLSEKLYPLSLIHISFIDHFPKDTELYRVMTTKPQEVASA